MMKVELDSDQNQISQWFPTLETSKRFINKDMSLKTPFKDDSEILSEDDEVSSHLFSD